MSAPVITLSSLRQLLAERFPQAAPTERRVLVTGVPAIDEAVGGLPRGALTEVVCTAASCGSHLLLGELLRATQAERGRMALVDGHDSFDPQSCAEDALKHLLWVRCRDSAMALQAGDLLSRDANFQVVVIDLRCASAAELRKTPAAYWYRLQRAVEPAELTLVVLTPHATVPSARLRLQLDRSHAFGALEEPRPAIAAALMPVVQRQRLTASA
jgi:hypothetical protein